MRKVRGRMEPGQDALRELNRFLEAEGGVMRAVVWLRIQEDVKRCCAGVGEG